MSYIPDGFKYIKDLRYIFYKDMPKPQYGIVFPYTKYPYSENNGYNYVFEKPKDKNANYLAMVYYLSNTHYSYLHIKNNGVKIIPNTDMNNDTNTNTTTDMNNNTDTDTNTDMNEDTSSDMNNDTNTGINTGTKSDINENGVTDRNEDRIVDKTFESHNDNNTLIIILIPTLFGIIAVIVIILLYKYRKKIRWPCQRNNNQNNIYVNNNNNQENIYGSSHNIYSVNDNNENYQYPEIPLGLRDTDKGINNLNENNNEPMICYPPINDPEFDNSSNKQKPMY